MASPIQNPAKVRVVTLEGMNITIGGLVQTQLQNLDANTAVYSIEYIRANNSQGVTCIITFELP